MTWISPPCTAPCTQSGVSSPFKSPICREADTSPFGFLPHNQSGWMNMEVVNIYSQNTGSFVPINMCSVSALGTGFTQQNRHESHCSQQSAVSYYLQHRVDCCCCDCEFHSLQPWDTPLHCTESNKCSHFNQHCLTRSAFWDPALIDVNTDSMKWNG